MKISGIFFLGLLLSVTTQAHICERAALNGYLEVHRQNFLANATYKTPAEFAANPDLYRSLFPLHAEHLDVIGSLEDADEATLTPLLRKIKASFAPQVRGAGAPDAAPVARLEGHPRFVALDTETTGFLPWDRITEIALVPINERFSRDGNSKTLSVSSYLDAHELPISLLQKAMRHLEKLTIVLRLDHADALVQISSNSVASAQKETTSLEVFTARFPELERRGDEFKIFIKALHKFFSGREKPTTEEATQAPLQVIREALALANESRLVLSPEEVNALIEISSATKIKNEDDEFTLDAFIARYPELKESAVALMPAIKSLHVAFDRQNALTLNHYLDGVEEAQSPEAEPSETERLDSELAMARKVTQRFLRYLEQPVLPILIGQNLAFDMPKITQMLERAYDVTRDESFRTVVEALPRFQILDTKLLIKIMWGRLLYAEYWITRNPLLKPLSSAKGEFMADLFQVNRDKWHGALFDSLATVEMLKHILALDLDLAHRLQALAIAEPERYLALKEDMEKIEAGLVLKKALEYAAHPYHQAHKRIYDIDNSGPQEEKKASKAKDNDQQSPDFSERLHLKEHPMPWIPEINPPSVK